MIKITRQEAKKQGLPTCYGSLCTKHPELNGLRRVSGACVECAKLSLKKRRKENPEIYLQYKKNDYIKLKNNSILWAKKLADDKKYRQKNKDKIYAAQLEWNKNNPDKVKAMSKRNRQNNKATRHASVVARRLSKINRTPAWLNDIDRERIKNEYKLAALLSKIEGVKWTVDHIIPLQGDLVSGLHVPSNLQVMRASKNFSKHNKFEAS